MKNNCNSNKKLILTFTIGAILFANALMAQQSESSQSGRTLTSNMINLPTKKADDLNNNTNSKKAKPNKPNCMDNNLINSNKPVNKKSVDKQTIKPEEPVTSPASYTYINSKSTLHFA
jgi:hypothetical protein